MKSILKMLPLHLWLLGFVCINFDLILTMEVYGFTLKISYLFFASSCLLVIAEQVSAEGVLSFIKSCLKKSMSLPYLFPTLLGFYALVGAPFSVIPLKSVVYSLWLIFDVAVVFGVATYLGRNNRFSIQVFYRYLSAIIVFTALVIVIDQIAYYYGYVGGLIGFNQDSLLKWGVSRPHAFTFEPSYAAAFLSLGTAFLLKELLFRREYLPAWLSTLAMSLGFVALILTTARSGWLSFAATFALMSVAVLLHFREKIKLLGTTLATSLIFILIFIFSTPSSQRSVLNQRLVSSMINLRDGSGNARLSSMLYGWTMAKESKFLGVGIGSNYAYWTRNKEAHIYTGETTEEEYGREVVMSTWAQILAELGIAGILLYLGFAITMISRLLKGLVNTNSATHGICVLTAVVFFIFTAHWLSNISRTDVWVWFAIWGVVAELKASDKIEVTS